MCEIVRLVALADLDAHNLLAATFKFYREEEKKYRENYRNHFIKRTKKEENGETAELTYYNGKLHSYMNEPAEIIKSHRYTRIGWCSRGEYHREHEAAVLVNWQEVYQCLPPFIVVFQKKQWWVNGKYISESCNTTRKPYQLGEMEEEVDTDEEKPYSLIQEFIISIKSKIVDFLKKW